MNRRTRWVIVAGLAWTLASAPSGHADESLDEILSAFNEVAQKGSQASPRAQALSFKHNLTLQHLRIAGRIPDGVYQANQSHFTAINDRLLKEAASASGLEYSPQQTKPGKVPTPGTDTDAIVRSGKPGQPMTAEQVSKARETYQRKAVEFLENNGVKTGGKAPNTNTSLLPDPTQMPESEWRKAIREAEKAGEVVYTDPRAAAAEAKIRAGQPLTTAEAHARVSEVGRLAREHFAEADRLAEAAQKLPPGSPQRQALEAQAQILRHNGAKYIQRIEETGQAIAKQAGLPPAPSPSGGLGAAVLRDPANRPGAARAAALGEHYAAQATINYIKNLAKAAEASKNMHTIAESQKAISQALNTLSPSAQGQVLEALSQSHGPAYARRVAEMARTMPKPPAAPPTAGRLSTASRYIGAAAVIYGGYDAISSVIKADDPSYEAGKKLGEFTGGSAGAYAGGMAGAKLGAMAGSVLGPAGAAAGGFVGAVAGGIIGYTAGSSYGREMGDTHSKWWDKNLSDEEFNRRALANSMRSPDQVRQNLIWMGVPPDRAAQVAELYKNGSLDAFRKELRKLRDEMVAQQKWSPKSFRRFADLKSNEVSALLHCLCSASLGANPWVMQGYNTNIPPGSKGYHCGDLANGPCMAQGFGCWRSFIKFDSPEAKECFSNANLEASGENVELVHSKYQRPFEKPFKVTVRVEPKEFCPGDFVEVEVKPEGGMGDYEFAYVVGPFLVKPEKIPKDLSRTRVRHFTLQGDTNAVRGLIGGNWVYFRPLEAYVTRLEIFVYSYTYRNGVRVQEVAHHVLGIRLKPHSECVKQQSPKEETATQSKPPSKPKAPATPPSPPPPEATQVPRQDEQTTAPPPSSPAVRITTRKKGPSDKHEPPAIEEAKRPEKVIEHDARSGRPSGSSSKEAKSPENIIEHDAGLAPTWGWTPKTNVPAKTTQQGPEKEVPTECQLSGGGYALPGQPAVIFAEVPSPHRVRITLRGSDGFHQSAEGVGRAELVRPPNPNGQDVIMIEDLDLSECREALKRTYGADGMPIAQEPITGMLGIAGSDLGTAEPTLPYGKILISVDSPAAEFLGSREAKTAARSRDSLDWMDAQGRLSTASRAGDAVAATAAQSRDAAGAAAIQSRSREAGKVAVKDADRSWGATLGDAVAGGIEQGLSSAASSFGTAAGERAAAGIFDRRSDRQPAADDEEGAHPDDRPSRKTAAPSAKPTVAGVADRGDSSTDGKRKPKPASEECDPECKPAGVAGTTATPSPPPVQPEAKPVTVTCPECGSTFTFPSESDVPKWCPNCCAGPNSVICSICGYRWCGRQGPSPAICPGCGARSAPDGEEPPTSITPTGAAKPGGAAAP